MARLAGRLAYDGTLYCGFQRQRAGLASVQVTVENALSQVTSEIISLMGAGRTDTGVHASGQVIAFDATWKHSTEELLKAINIHLPSDIALQSLMEVAASFHPRFDALSRTYLYRLYISPTRDPLRERYVWHRQLPLNLEAMQEAIQLLRGEHDFATFGKPPKGENTVRVMTTAQIEAMGDELHVTLTANAFLKRMVRSIVGTLVEVGRGKMNVAEFAAAFRLADRKKAGTSAPPHGLTLTHVVYNDYRF
ncbi:MAG: tRNA pseudouridine(38-40) synthase TruA [Chloroflexi bacterium]|nr:tRNA pseudouridine(38-40) synthase TruA [Chloroflexota bacterium]